ncbi:hypothetical protein ACFL3H_01320 [Gemmatimonadota bacterium]
MDLLNYPIGEDGIPAREASMEQLSEEAAVTTDPETKKRLEEVAHWRAFFNEFHGKIEDGLSGQMDADNLDMVVKILAWETQSIIETMLKEGRAVPI